MVYESDFYTVRRPYSRPNITSYSVTAPRISVTTWKVKPSIRTSVLIGELDRIHHRSRPHLAYVPTEDFLNSRPMVDFDDETKIIRAETERLMKRIYTSVPHPRNTTPLQILPYYGQHFTSKYYSPRHHNTVSEDILNMSYYNEPSARTIGRGHLACVSFAGGRGYPRRKHLYSDENRDIRDEIKFRSYYNKNRAYEEAMSLPTGFASYLLRLQPDNRNGMLTCSEKLHITNILKERKEKNNSSVGHQIIAHEAINGNLEKQTSSYKSKSVDETVPLKRETIINRSNSRDSNSFEKSRKEINISIEKPPITENLTKSIPEESQRSQNVPEKAPEPTPIVKKIERIVEINIESKAPEEKCDESYLNPSRDSTNTKTKSEEVEQKTVNEPELEVKEEQKDIADTQIEAPEKTKEKSSEAIVPQLPDTAEQVKQETIADQNTEEVIQASIIEQSTPETSEESIIRTDVPTTIEEDTNCLNTHDNESENIVDNVLNNVQAETIEKREIITEKGIDETVSDNTESLLEIQDEKQEKIISEDVPESFTETIQQTITETKQVTIIESSQVTLSSKTQETIETIVKSNETEDENTQQESISEQIIHEIANDPHKLVLDESSEGANTEVQEKNSDDTKESSEKELQNNNTIQQEVNFNQLNEEFSTNLNNPLQEKIIEIEIIRSDETTEQQSMIEEVTDLGSPSIQRDFEVEPLIEEPQSPESDLIYDKTITNEVCELLSDVPEEV